MKQFTLKILLIVFSIIFFNCTAKKEIIISKQEIVKAYNSKNLSDIKKLERIVLNEKRNLSGRSLLAIAYYINYLNQKKNKSEAETNYLKNIDEFLLKAYTDLDNFNLKNLALLGMNYYYSNNQTENFVIFLKKILSDNKTHPEVKNFSLRLAQELFKQKKTSDKNLANLCFRAADNTNNQIFYNALMCFLASPDYDEGELFKVKPQNSFQEVTLEQINNK